MMPPATFISFPICPVKSILLKPISAAISIVSPIKLEHLTLLSRSRGNISEIEKELEKYNFVRIHRSYIVNLKYVSKVLSKEVTVGEHVLPVSRNYKEKLKDEYLKYIRGEE